MKRMLVLYFIGISVRRCIVEDADAEANLKATLDKAMEADTVTLIKVGDFKFSIRHFVGYEFYDEPEKPPEPEPETLRLQRRAVEILEREAKSGEDWKGDE